jgi:hypothetical protein
MRCPPPLLPLPINSPMTKVQSCLGCPDTTIVVAHAGLVNPRIGGGPQRALSLIFSAILVGRTGANTRILIFVQSARTLNRPARRARINVKGHPLMVLVRSE